MMRLGFDVGNMLKKNRCSTCSSSSSAAQSLSTPVMNGGPVANDRGFILHTPKDTYQSSIEVTSDVNVTTSKDILTVLGTEAEPGIIWLRWAIFGVGMPVIETIKQLLANYPAIWIWVFHTPVHAR